MASSVMTKKQAHKNEDEGAPRTEQAREAAQENANDLREIIKKLPKPPLDG